MYRKDIDGLRALAVVPVVLFHAGLTVFSGGFVGVDVFFVISGFLITGIIRNGMEQGHYSIREFYERRIRRILPAFATVTVVTLILGWWLLLPGDFKAYGTSLWSSAIFGSNITFWQSSGDYFATPSGHQPLLHMWSLSVEEQFYIFFPLLIFALYNFKLQRFINPILAAILLISLAISVYGAVYVPVATFYLLPTRAWELIAGGLLAYGVVPASKSRLQAEVEGLVGLGLILASVFMLNSHSFFPGAAALPPVVGALLILHAGIGDKKTAVSYLLKSGPARFIGLISYSLYLWHWPIIVFTRYYLIESGPLGIILMILASVAAAIVSWRYIEMPFRQKRDGLSQGRLFVVASSILASLTVAGLVIFLAEGFPQRLSPQLLTMSLKKTYQGPGRECGGAFRTRRTVENLCVIGDKAAQPTFLLVGDSHAEAMAAAVSEAAITAGTSGLQLTDTGYRPVLGFRKLGEPEKYAYLNGLVVKALAAHPTIANVVVPVYWNQAAMTDHYLDAGGKVYSGRDGMAYGLAALLKRYPDKRFLFLIPSAHSDTFGAEAAARSAWYKRAYNPMVPRQTVMQERTAYQQVLDGLARQSNVRFLDLSTKLCDRRLCYGEIGGNLVYTDDNHLSYWASQQYHADLTAFLETHTQVTLASH